MRILGRLSRPSLAIALAAYAIAADGLPPGVVLLAHIKSRMASAVSHLPDYSCLETVARSRGVTGQAKASQYDTVRLEVLFSGRKELYASLGGSTFEDRHPSSFTASGMMADGLFAGYLQALFVDDNGLFTYQGEESLMGRRTAKYDWRVPLRTSATRIDAAGGHGNVALKGTFWADPETLDLIRLKVEADEIPPTLPIKEMTAIMDYARTRIGESDVLLPQTGAIQLVSLNRAESRNVFEFTHCRAFHAESTLSFGTAEVSPAAASSKNTQAHAAPLAAIPGGLTVRVKLTHPITEKQAVGDLIEGSIAEDVASKGKVVLQAGAIVRGRMRRLEHYADTDGFYALGIEFTEVQTEGGTWSRFFAGLQGADHLDGLEWVIANGTTRTVHVRTGETGGQPRTELFTLTDLPGVGSFFVRKSHFEIPAGFEMLWKTESQ